MISYAALGLATSLNPRVAGGVERVTADTEDNGDIIEVDMTSSEPSLSTHKADANSGSLPKGHGRIVRDEQGNVVEVEMEDEVDDEAPEEEPLIEERASGVTPETKDWVTMPARKQATEVVQGKHSMSVSRGRSSGVLIALLSRCHQSRSVYVSLHSIKLSKKRRHWPSRYGDSRRRARGNTYNDLLKNTATAWRKWHETGS